MNPNIGIVGKATQFKTRPAGSGRKPSLVKQFLKHNNMTIDDYVYVFENIITKYTLAEVKAMVTEGIDKDGKPIAALIGGFCLAWIADCKRGNAGGGIFNQMLDRKFGKVKESIDLKHSGSIDIISMTPAERDARIKEIERKRRERETQSEIPRTGGEAPTDTNPV